MFYAASLVLSGAVYFRQGKYLICVFVRSETHFLNNKDKTVFRDKGRSLALRSARLHFGTATL